MTQGAVYVWSQRVAGVGGLPTGTAGKVVALLSAGIDSPVATWRIMRRGAVAVGLHFSGRPQTSDLSERLVAEIGSALEPSGGLGRIYVVAFGDLQREISLAVNPDLRVLIYRRLMIRVAEAIARVERAKALVTGESLGQVASQTLENIVAVDEAATLPVLRPLIGSDKLEIMAEARRLGTYELSTQQHEDCCTLFMPRNPETHAKLPAVLEAWGQIDVERMVEDALASLTWIDFACPSYRPPARWPATALVAMSDRLRILALEPYYGGSHRAVLDGLAARIDAEWTLLTLPARKWKWRMRGAAITMAEEARSLAERTGSGFDLVFASTFVNLAEFRGLAGARLAAVPAIVYFHENQLVYPNRHTAEWDFQFPLTNITSALSAECCAVQHPLEPRRVRRRDPGLLAASSPTITRSASPSASRRSRGCSPPPFDPAAFDAAPTTRGRAVSHRVAAPVGARQEPRRVLLGGIRARGRGARLRGRGGGSELPRDRRADARCGGRPR